MKPTAIRVKEGVLFIAAHFEPESALILRVLFQCAPETTDGLIWITEGFRPPRHPRDLHTVGRAFDLRIHNIMEPTAARRIVAARAWVARARAVHGDARYQFEIHGATPAEFHVHAEFDQK